MIWHRTIPAPLTAEGRARLVRLACPLLRGGDLAKVEALLAEGGAGAAADAACLNLHGVVCEARGETERAKRWYGRAIRADRRFAAAQENMRRLYELNSFGRSERAVRVGDALMDLWLGRWTRKRRF